MPSPQTPLPTPFPPSSTAQDVLAGLDLTGRQVLVTAGHTGLGLEVTRALSHAGASVLVAARDARRAAEAVVGLERVEVDRLDLIDPGSVTALAERRIATGRPLHVLVNGAGAPPPPRVQRDARGYEVQLATNHLGHMQLTLALMPALLAARGARVVTVSSGAQRFGQIRWEDPHFLTGGYDPGVAYAQSKLANVLFTVELDRRYRHDDVRAYAAHPGVVAGTALNSAAGPESLRAQGLIDDHGLPVIDPERGKKSPQQGASTIVMAAASPLLEGVGGVYLRDNDISPIDDEPRPLTADSVPSEVTSHAIDPVDARRLWEMSELMLTR